MPSPSALSTHVQPSWVEILAWHLLYRASLISAKGWDAIQGLGPGSPRAGSSEPVTLPGSARPLSRPAGPHGGGLGCSLAKLLLGPQPAHGGAERPCPQWKGAPGWPSAHSGDFPVRAAAEQSWGRGSSSSVRDGGPGPECAVGAPGQGPLLS